MKKYNLSAEFVRWEGSGEENTLEPDSFGYIIDLESEEEAKIRLDSLIIERMTSKPGWNYRLVTSSLAEFPLTDALDAMKIMYEQPVIIYDADSMEEIINRDANTATEASALDEQEDMEDGNTASQPVL